MNARTPFRGLLSFLFLVLLTTCVLHAQSGRQPVWKDNAGIKKKLSAEKKFRPASYRALTLDFISMKQELQKASFEFTSGASRNTVAVLVPMPDGSMSAFKIVETNVMHPDLAANFPEIKTYAGQGVDDKNATIRLDVTPHGFHAMILSPAGTVFIDPVSQTNTSEYISYNKKDLVHASAFVCETGETNDFDHNLDVIPPEVYAQRTSGMQLRTYRLALGCTGEYAVTKGGTKAGALAGMVTTMNRVNGVYEKEVAVRMVIIPNDTLIIYTNAATDPYTNSNGSTMLGQNQIVCDSIIGTANYDMGHVFSTGGGGVATLGIICNAAYKARGVTGSSNPVGDAFDIDFVSHEMGHQFGANHTFNSATSACTNNRTATAAYEPGSGITIMSYAGICGSDNLAAHSIAYFHTHSFDQITTYTTTGTGNTCPVTTSSGNTAPVVTSMGANYTIPVSTPFMLTGTATDANGDAMTYSWEQYDLGAAGAWNANAATAPLFRTFPPAASASRIFPQLTDILNNTTTIGEILPSVPRTLHFRFTARDNRTGGGGVMHPDTTVSIIVANNGGAFSVTAPNTAVTWFTGSTQTVTWNVNGTTASPISCANVKITFSADGGITFPTTLAASTPNDGSQPITVPATLTTLARIKVEAVGNIFFDISNANFIIQSSTPGLVVIATSPLAVNLCKGNAVNVDFTTSGPANSGNIFTAQLSDSLGVFTVSPVPVTIGTLNSMVGGTISAVIPPGTTSGSLYRIRVISSSPAVIGSTNGTNITILNVPAAAGTITGSAVVCQGQTPPVVYSVPAIANATGYSWTIPVNATITAGSTTNTISVSYSDSALSGSISVFGYNAGCSGSVSPNLAITVNPIPGASAAIIGPSLVCQGQTGVVYSIPPVVNATYYLWQAPAGAVIVGPDTANTITLNFSDTAGSSTLFVIGLNDCGGGISFSFLPINVNQVPVTPVISTGSPTTVCYGDSVNLSVPLIAGVSYQWRKNGVNIPGAVSSSYAATTAGSYDVAENYNLPGSQTFSNTTPIAIPDNTCSSPTPAIRTIAVSNYPSTVTTSGISVLVNITHPYIGDLDLLLNTPDNKWLGLSNRAGGDGDNFTNTIFSDAGATSLPLAGAPYTGMFKPWPNTFTSCIGTNITSFASIFGGALVPNGNWKLYVYDRGGADLGTIDNWSITFPAANASGCVRISNSVMVLIDSIPVISSFTPASGFSGSTVNLVGNHFSSVTSVLVNGLSASYTASDNNHLAATVPSGVTTGLISVTNLCGTGISSTPFIIAPPVLLNLKIMIEGFYLSNGEMKSILFDEGLLTDPSACDSIIVELRDTLNVDSVAVVSRGLLHTNGTAQLSFSASVIGRIYFVALRHRNSVATWSKYPLLFNSSVMSFDFSSP